MEEQSSGFLTQPFTFGGVAACARISWTRLALFQVAVALLAAGAVVLFFEAAWAPVLKRAIEMAPKTGAIQHRSLDWPSSSPTVVMGSTFLWISVDPTGALPGAEGADLQVEFRKTELRLRSLFGYSAVPYPEGWMIALNRPELEPWWGAWHPGITIGLGAAVILNLFVIWTLIALAYLWPVRLIAFYADRKLSWGGAWRMATASLLPGALFLTLAIVAYTLHHIHLVQLLLAAVLHVMIGWAYVLASPFCLPKQPLPGSSPAKNPFGTSAQKPGNPFAGPR